MPRPSRSSRSSHDLITTAGKVGAEAARLLARRKEPVRILVRDPVKATALTRAGVEVVAGGLTVPETIDAAMRYVSSVILVSPADPVRELNVIGSATRAAVTHIVKITSKASMDSPIARRRGQAEIEARVVRVSPHSSLRSPQWTRKTIQSSPPRLCR
ncbi:MAG TPA: NAD(P)H-binding protein [Actinoplanes sp.]|nr:NAD(P)H-binding protein [Actinoplanes sp.]